MTISMSDILCITNRNLCEEDFLVRIEKIAMAHPKAIVLREKDLNEDDYRVLAKEVIHLCKKHHVPCVLHTFADAALELSWTAIHLPMEILRGLSKEKREMFTVLGTSCHSVEEAVEAETLGCTYITAGHIFETDCKKGLPGRGIKFLQAVCKHVSIPVYAIGGITPQKYGVVQKAGANGVCVMSSLMKCDDPEDFLAAFKEKYNEI